MIASLIILGFTRECMAHGAGYRILEAPETVSAMFYYSGGEPMSFAQIRVFGPNNNDDVEFQNGRTDAKGCFSFLPDRPGKWLIKVQDGRGHAVRAAVSVGHKPVATDTAHKNTEAREGIQPGWQEILLGLSLIVNIFIGLGFVRKKYFRKKR